MFRPRLLTSSARWLFCAFALFGCAHLTGARVGAAVPMAVVTSARNGRWVVACMATEDTDHNGRLAAYWSDTEPFGPSGDRMRTYFLEGAQPGFPLDDWLGADATGRWVAFVRKGRLIARDTVGGRELDFTARAAVGSFLSFSPDGVSVVYRARSPRPELVMENLNSGAREAIDEPSANAISFASLSPNGDWLELWMGMPVLASAPSDCDRRRYPSDFGMPDRVRSLRSAAQVDLHRKGFYVRHSVVHLRDDGAVVATDPLGAEAVWAPATCGAKLLFAGVKDTVGVGCTRQRNHLWLLRPSGSVDTGLEVLYDDPAAVVRPAIPHARPLQVALVSVVTSRSVASDGLPLATEHRLLLDLAHGTRTVVPDDALLVAQGERCALLSSNHGPGLVTLRDDAITWKSVPSGAEFVAMPWVTMGNEVFNLDTGAAWVVHTTKRIEGLSNEPAVLLQQGSHIMGVASTGPLEWVHR